MSTRFAGHPVQENDLTERSSEPRVTGYPGDSFERLFIDLGEHSAHKALLLLTDAIHCQQRDMNAYDWLSGALPGATLKPAFAFGTVGELYRSFVRPTEFARLNALRRS
jgi:hypothetical protein